MTRRIAVAVAAVAALGVAAAPASAAPLKNKIRISGGPVYKPGVMIGDNVRFNAATTVKSGGTINVVNRANPESGPHTISLIKRSVRPLTFAQANECFEGGGVCGPLFPAHQVDPETQEPAVLEYNAGAPGFDTMGDTETAGDSIFIAPGQQGVSFDVTAAKGSRLFYFCAVHPWMQGKITVN